MPNHDMAAMTAGNQIGSNFFFAHVKKMCHVACCIAAAPKKIWNRSCTAEVSAGRGVSKVEIHQDLAPV